VLEFRPGKTLESPAVSWSPATVMYVLYIGIVPFLENDFNQCQFACPSCGSESGENEPADDEGQTVVMSSSVMEEVRGAVSMTLRVMCM
jgi:hypothetical protein